jgi:anti-sigma factor RsiW
MSDVQHLDDGRLHAYLDGHLRDGTVGRDYVERHLAECASCRARLEEERRVRDRARAILGAAGPVKVAMPPFEAVLERAERQRTSRSGIRPVVALAWAASLALALTVGWYARSLVLTGGETATVATAEKGTEAAAEDLRATGIQAALPAGRQVAQGPPAPPASPREEPGQAPPAADTGAVTPISVPAVEDRPAANVAVSEAKAERDTEPAPVRVAEAPAPNAAAERVMRRAAPERAMPSVVPQPAAADLAQPAWLTVSPAEAEQRLGGPVAMIAGLPSLGTSVFGTGDGVVVRTLQVLGPGLTVELLQRRTAAPERERVAAAQAAMPQAGRALQDEPGQSLTVQWEGFSVTGRALVPADSLRKLLGSLRRP